jgi:hypothetical protein
MSLNITPLTEVSRDVLNCTQLAVSTADLISGFPILAPDGNVTAPTYSFASNVDTGLFRSSAGVSMGVDSEVGMVAGPTGNVAVGSTPSGYGGGEGVVFLTDAVVDPIGMPNGGSGGILYVDGQEMNFLNSAGSVTTLTTAGGSDVTGPNSSLANQLATFNSITGNVITNSPIQYVSSQLLPGDGTSLVPSYSFISEPNTGLYLSGSSLNFSVLGSTALSLNASSATFEVPFSSSSPASAATPAFSFTSSTSSGIFYGGDHVQISSGGTSGMAIGGNGARNVSVAGGAAADYGTGANGVLFVPTATTDPVGIPNGGSGGVLYVTSGGTQLRWLDASGTSVLLGGSVDPAGTVADNSLAIWANTSGSSVTSGPVITDAGAIQAVQSGTIANPAYSFTASTTAGMVLSAPGTVAFQGSGTPDFSVNSTAMTALLQVQVLSSSGASPSMSFASETSSGLFQNSSGTFRVTVGPSNVFTVREPTSNITICSIDVSDYGGGEGLIRLEDAVTNPSSAPIDGGFLYVDGDDLLFRDTDNVEHTLTSTTSVNSVGSSTANGVVRFDTTDGKIVQDTSTILISDGGQVTTSSAQGYSFTSSTTSGLSSSGGDIVELVSAGTTSLTLNTSGTTVETGHELLVSDGSVSLPSLSFTLDTDTGLYLSAPNTLSVSSGGVHSLTVDSTQNVALGSTPPDFAGGQGVVFFSDVVTQPSTVLSNGGVMFVNGRNLFFHDKDATLHQLSGTEGIGSSTASLIVTLSDTVGKGIKESGFSLSDSNQITGPDGSAGAPPYTVGGSVGWWYGGANTVEMGDGANQLSVNSAATIASVQLELSGSNGLRVGGSGGMTETFTSPTTTRTVGNASGTFVWQQNGTPIFQSSASRDVDLLSNFAVCTGATGDFSMGFDGVSFDLDVANAADSLLFSVGGTAMGTFSTAGLTAHNVSANRIGGDLRFTSDTTSGITGPEVEVNGNMGFQGIAGGKLGLFGSAAPSGTRVLSLEAATTAPTTAPTSGVYLYVDSTADFMRVANKDVDVAINGPHAHARISRTQTIATGAIDLVDTLVDVESNILVVDTASPGAGTITGTAATGGWWEISAEAAWASNATGFRRIRIKVGGVVVGDSTENAVSGAETQHQVRVSVNVAASAVVTYEVEQNSGGNLDVDVIGTVVFLG